MKILALERELPGAVREQFQIYAKAETRAAWDLYQRGIIRELYFRAAAAGAGVDDAGGHGIFLEMAATINDALTSPATLPRLP